MLLISYVLNADSGRWADTPSCTLYWMPLVGGHVVGGWRVCVCVFVCLCVCVVWCIIRGVMYPLDIVKARKLAHYGHTMRKQGSCLEKEIMQGTVPGARRRGRPHTAWMDNIKTWTGLSVDESVRMTEDRDKWRKYVHDVTNPRIEEG